MPPSASFRLVRARIPDGGNDTVETSIVVRDGRIERLGAGAAPGLPDLDAGGAWVLPGAIDGHVHFDEPGFTHREDFSSGTRAAAAGGVTTVVDMPCTSLPPVVDADAFRAKLHVIAPRAHVDFALWGGVRGNGFEPATVDRSLASLATLGVRNIKTYLISGMDTFEDLGRDELEHVMRTAARLDLVVGVHAEDREMIDAATASAHHDPDGRSAGAYARIRSAEAEARGVQTCLELAASTGARLHIVHLACGAGVEGIRRARAGGVRVTAETCPHYLQFTVDDLLRMGAVLKTAPVVKSAADREALWQGLADGTIDMIATDHAPGQWPEEKHTGSFWSDYGGVPGVELMLSYVLSEGVAAGRISLERAVELLSAGPARVHRLGPAKGALREGADADLVVFDPAQRWTVSAAQLQTRQKYTPFEGMTMVGRVLRTFVRGVEVFEQVQGPIGMASGRLVAREPLPS